MRYLAPRRMFYIFNVLFAGAILLSFQVTQVLAQEASAEEGIYYLTLDECTRLALENNFDIQLAKYDAKIARTKKGVAESIYDTILEAEVKYRNSQKAQSTTLVGTKALDNDYNISLEKKLPSGTTVDLDMTNNRNWTNSPFVTNNPTHDSALKVSVRQELGRNFFGIEDRGNIKITKLDIENSDYSSFDRIEQSIEDVQIAYGDLVLAVERRDIEEEMVAQAKRLYDLHQEKLKDGLVELPEFFATDANYKTRLNELKLAENDVKTKSNILRLLLNVEDNSVKILPKDNFYVSDKEKRLDQSLKAAFENRRDYKRTLNDIKSKNIKLAMKKNSLWPEINLTASFERNGLGDHFKQAVTNISDEDNPEIYAGITFSIPLENTKARSELSAAKLEKAKTLVNLKLVERKISIQIMDKVRNCNVFKELAQDSKKIVELQKKKLEEEEKRFDYGRSNTDTIIRFQEDLLRAQLSAAQAMLRYFLAVIELEQAQGSLLSNYWDGEI